MLLGFMFVGWLFFFFSLHKATVKTVAPSVKLLGWKAEGFWFKPWTTQIAGGTCAVNRGIPTHRQRITEISFRLQVDPITLVMKTTI